MIDKSSHDFFRRVGAGMGLGATTSIIDGNAPIRLAGKKDEVTLSKKGEKKMKEALKDVREGRIEKV